MPKEKAKAKVKPVHESPAGPDQGRDLGQRDRERHRAQRDLQPPLQTGRRQWKDSTSFGRDDLPLLAKVADRVHSWIFEQSQEQNGSQKPGAERFLERGFLKRFSEASNCTTGLILFNQRHPAAGSFLTCSLVRKPGSRFASRQPTGTGCRKARLSA